MAGALRVARKNAFAFRITSGALDLTNLSSGKSRRVSPSGTVSEGEGFDRIRPAGGRPWMAGHFRETGCRVENPRAMPDPAEGH